MEAQSMRTPHVQGRSTKTKTPVFGMMESSTFINKKDEVENITYVHAFVVENTTRATLQPIIQQFVEEGSRVITDELNAYNGLDALGYAHAVVNHGVEEYAAGDVFLSATPVVSIYSPFVKYPTSDIAICDNGFSILAILSSTYTYSDN